MKNLFVIKNFSGIMTTEGDATDLRPEDAVELENLVADRGLLKLDRNKVEVGAESNFVITYLWYYGFGLWFEPVNSDLVFAYRVKDTTPKLTCRYGNDINLSNSIAAKQMSATVDLLKYKLSIFVPYKNVLRVGNNVADLPGAIVSFDSKNRFNGANILNGLNLYTDYVDGEGCAVYPVEIYTDSVTSTTAGPGVYSSHHVGIYLLSKAGGGSYSSGDKVVYGITAIYDYNQESPMTIIRDTYTVGGGHDLIEITLWVGAGLASQSLPDPRITGYNIYRAINSVKNASAEDFYLLYYVDINTGLAAGDDISDTANNWGLFASYYYRLSKFKDAGLERIENYKDRTGLTRYNLSETTNYAVDTRIYWDFGAMINGRMVVNCLAYYDNGNKIVSDVKRLYISEVGKPDVFLPSNYIQFAQENSTPFKAIISLGRERMLIWDSYNTYIINVASDDPLLWYKEKDYKFSLKGSSYAQVPNGIAFPATEGIYIINTDGELTELTRPIRSWWRNLVYSSARIYYDPKYKLLYVARVNSGTYYGTIFDYDTQGIYMWSDSKALGSIALANYFFSGFDNETHFFTILLESTVNCYIRTIKAGTSKIDITYKSPWLTLTNYAARKTAKHLFIKYKAGDSINDEAANTNVYFDGSNVATYSFQMTGSLGVLKEDKFRIPKRFQSIQIEIVPDDAVNGFQYAFELHEISIEYKPGRAR